MDAQKRVKRNKNTYYSGIYVEDMCCELFQQKRDCQINK